MNSGAVLCRALTTGFFELAYSQNPGNLFGALIGNPALGLVTKLAVYLFVGTLLKGFLREFRHRQSGAIAAGLVAGGAVGNVADILLFGGRTDMIRLLHCGWLSNLVFNLADLAIGLGLTRTVFELCRGSATPVSQ